MMKISAFVTTFNRLELLKKVIAGLCAQTYPIQNLTIINNSSEDGTIEWLESEGLAYITQPNVGSSGGQYRAVSEGVKMDTDYIWIMDDDVIPTPTCLENLIKHASPNRIIAPLRWGSDGQVFENEPIRLNMSNPFKSIWGKIIDKSMASMDFIPAEGLTFEGPLMPRALAEKIGPPEFSFFIHADDTEYMLRARAAGAEMGLVPSARLDRMLAAPDINKEFSWKHYYIIRNIIALDILHGNAAVRMMRPFFYLQAWLRRANNSDDRRTAMKAFRDGYTFKRLSRQEIEKKLEI